MADPTAPTAPTPVNMTVSAAKRTVPIANATQFAQYLAGTYLGGLTWGDDVSIALGVYAPAFPYTLPAYTSVAGTQTGNDFITFRSANQGVLPAAGSTVSRSDTVNMPTFTSPSATNGVFVVADNARNFRFVGLDISGALGYGGLMFQAPSNNLDELTHPRNFIIDRCCIHFDPSWGGINAVSLSGRDMAIINCAIYDFFQQSGEPHAILIASGRGPYLIHQNYIETVGCGVFIGDSVMDLPGVTPSDVTMTENYIQVPPALNNMGFLYNAGTAGLNAAGDVVTLAGTGVATDPVWNDGSTYFTLTGPRNANGYYKPSIKIIGVNLDGANTFRLATPWEDDGSRNTAALLYHVTKWAGVVNGVHKNLLECKHVQRLKCQGNVFARSPRGQQLAPIIFSQRGEQSAMTDILFQDNVIYDCSSAISISSRAADGTGQGFAISSINGSAGGLITMHCSGNIDITVHGGNCEITNVDGCTEANGIWPMTRIDNTTFTIPVTWSGIAWGGHGSVSVYKYCTPPARIAIKNNLILNTGSPQAIITDSFPNHSSWFTIGVNTNPVLVASGGSLVSGGNDANLSTTGTWAMEDFCFEHNTVVGPRTSGALLGVFNAYEYNNNNTATDWKNPRWTFRNNIMKISDPVANARQAFTYWPAGTNLPGVTFGTQCLDKFTDAGRNFLHNVLFRPWSNTDLATFTGTDDDKLAIVPDYQNVGFTSYAGTSEADLANFILQDLYTVGSCSVTNGSTIVNFSGGASLPSTIVKGVPFKGPDGLYYLVDTRVSATQLTLQTTYLGANAGGAYTLGFRGWSSDGSDPGANLTTLASAIAQAGVGGGGGGGGGGGNPTGGALAVTGRGSTLGFALIPQTP